MGSAARALAAAPASPARRARPGWARTGSAGMLRRGRTPEVSAPTMAPAPADGTASAAGPGPVATMLSIPPVPRGPFVRALCWRARSVREQGRVWTSLEARTAPPSPAPTVLAAALAPAMRSASRGTIAMRAIASPSLGWVQPASRRPSVGAVPVWTACAATPRALGGVKPAAPTGRGRASMALAATSVTAGTRMANARIRERRAADKTDSAMGAALVGSTRPEPLAA